MPRTDLPPPSAQQAPSVPSETDRIRLPEEQYLLDLSAKLADELIYRPAQGPTSNDRDQAYKALLLLQRAARPLTARTLSKLLVDLGRRSGARDELFRLSKHSGLGDYLVGLGVSATTLAAKAGFDLDDATVLFTGVMAGAISEAGVNLRDFAVIGALFAAGAAVMTPGVAAFLAGAAVVGADATALKRSYRTAKEVLTAIDVFMADQVQRGLEAVRSKRAEIDRLIASRKYYDAGVRLGEVGVQVVLAGMALRDLAKFVSKLAPRLRKLTSDVALRFRLAELEEAISKGNLASGEANGWQFVRLPNHRLLLRRAEIGAVEIEAKELSRLAGQQARENAASATSPWPKLKFPERQPSAWAARRPSPAPQSAGQARGVTPEARALARGNEGAVASRGTDGATPTGTSRTAQPPGIDTNRQVLHERLAATEQQLFEAKLRNDAYKQIQRALGKRASGGPGFKEFWNAQEQRAALRHAQAHSNARVLTQVRPVRLIYPDGAVAALPEASVQGRIWDMGESVDLKKWRLAELKSTEAVKDSVRGGLRKGPIEGTLRSSSSAAKEFNAAELILDEMRRSGAKIELRGQNVLTGIWENHIVEVDDISQAFTDYWHTSQN